MPYDWHVALCETGCDNLVVAILIMFAIVAVLMLVGVISTAMALSATLQRSKGMSPAASGALALLGSIGGWLLFGLAMLGSARNGGSSALWLLLPAAIGSVVWARIAGRRLRDGSMRP